MFDWERFEFGSSIGWRIDFWWKETGIENGNREKERQRRRQRSQEKESSQQQQKLPELKEKLKKYELIQLWIYEF